MKDKIHSITRIILYVLMAISVIAGVVFYTMYDSGRTLPQLLEDLNNPYLNEVLYWAGILLGIIVLITIASPIFNFIINPKNAIKILISLGIFVVVVVIGYSMAGNNFSDLRMEELEITAETSKLVGMGLYVTYIAFGLTILAALYASIVKVFK